MARFAALLLAGLLLNATLGAAATLAFVLLCTLIASARIMAQVAQQRQAAEAKHA